MLDRKEYLREYQKKNRERLKEYRKQYRISNKEKIREDHKQYYISNKEKIRECFREYYKEYYISNKKKIREYLQQYYTDNKENKLKNGKQYRISNKEKISKYMNKYVTDRLKTDVKFNLNFKIRNMTNKSLKGNKAGRHWENLVGYTLNDLHRRLLQTMPIDYTWQDFIEGRLHIDHIIPISVFNFTRPEHIDFKRCWALENLRLLPAEENLRKNAKLYKPFQPALAF